MTVSCTTLTPTAYEPVSLDEAKTHCRVTGSADDTLLGVLISAARKRVEDISWRTLMPATLQLTLDDWPNSDTIELWLPPLQSVTSIQYTVRDGTAKTLSSDAYVVDTASTPGRVRLKADYFWPTDNLREVGGIVITYQAGVSNTTATAQNVATIRALVSPIHKAAILLIVGHLYENREAVVSGAGLSAFELPMGVDALLTPDRAFLF